MPKTYDQLVQEQTNQLKPPVITVDLSQLMEEEVAEEKAIDNDDTSTTSGVTEGPEFVEDSESIDKGQESSIELFGNSDAYTVS